MEREKLVDIWFVFGIWNFEVNFGDFICITCILCVALVEYFKIAVKIQVWLSKLHALATWRLYHVTAHSLYIHIRFYKGELKSTEFWVLWTSVPVCRTDAQSLCCPNYKVSRSKITVLWARPQNEACSPDFPVLSRREDCGTFITPD